MTESRWLLLAHQLPTRLSNARVKTWRRLQQIGAVPVRNSVYVLPNTEQCREDIEWLRGEIVALGGEATVFSADVVGDDAGDEVTTAFRAAREADYLALKREVETLGRAARSQRATRPPMPLLRAGRGLRERLTAIERIDFFNAPGRQAVEGSLDELERRFATRPPAAGAPPARLSAQNYHNRRWVTRPRPGVDRMASAWLIRRFIDPEASFGFSNRKAADGEIGFDMYEGDFTHDGALCTFEVIVRQFGIGDATVARVGQLVHDLDLKDHRYEQPDAPAIGRMIDGLRAVHADDHVLLEHGITMFEALARSFASGDASPRSPATNRRRGSQRRKSH